MVRQYASSGHKLAQISPKLFPFNIMPNIILKKCVNGKNNPKYCAHSGIPNIGKVNPVNKIEKAMKTLITCTASNWDVQKVAIVKPNDNSATI